MILYIYIPFVIFLELANLSHIIDILEIVKKKKGNTIVRCMFKKKKKKKKFFVCFVLKLEWSSSKSLSFFLLRCT